MTYAEWSKNVLAANRLQDVVDGFATSGENVWCLDRHVLGVGDSGPVLEDAAVIVAACRVAISLFREWDAVANHDREDSILVARPMLVIDDDWLEGVDSAQPPHVVTTIARHA